jgi:hypothetical protein
MDLSRNLEGPRAALARRARTGPLPTVPWQSFRRTFGLEDHLPAAIVGGLVILAIIQLALVL